MRQQEIGEARASQFLHMIPIMLEAVASGTTDIQNILTMKLYYNTHQVKYEITGDIPYGVVPPVESTHKYKTQIDVEVPLNVPDILNI